MVAEPPSIGQDIAHFRAEIGATQSQLASKSGVDQSRVSRIEKGEIAAPSELDKILNGADGAGVQGCVGLWGLSGQGLAAR
jgi:predicted transcriptional regulator